MQGWRGDLEGSSGRKMGEMMACAQKSHVAARAVVGHVEVGSHLSCAAPLEHAHVGGAAVERLKMLNEQHPVKGTNDRGQHDSTVDVVFGGYSGEKNHRHLQTLPRDTTWQRRHNRPYQIIVRHRADGKEATGPIKRPTLPCRLHVASHMAQQPVLNADAPHLCHNARSWAVWLPD